MERFRLFQTGDPHRVGLGFDTAKGSFLIAADKAQLLEMIAKLRIAADRIKEPK